MNAKKEKNIAKIKALYSRMHRGSLAPEDTIPFEELEFATNEDYLERIYLDREEFDRSLKAFGETYDVFRIFPEAAVVLDVGAHWGYSAVAMRHRGCRSKILSIEAMPFNMPALRRLAALMPGHYDYVNIAVSAQGGELVFYVPTMNGVAVTGLASTGATLDNYFAFLVADLADSHSPKTLGGEDVVKLAIKAVPATTIDHILASRAIEARRVAAIKMDVEGHEGPALQGAASLFRNQKPLLMLENANRDPLVVQTMLGYGYFHAERRNGCLVPHVAFSYANDGFWIHPDRIEEYRQAGIFEGEAPTREEANRPVELRWNARDGFV